MKNYPKTITEAIDRLLHIHHEEDLISLDLPMDIINIFEYGLFGKSKYYSPKTTF